MTTLSLTDVNTNDPILAANLNNGWSALRSVVNGNLDETNFASGQVYSPSKIKQDGASANDVMYWTGSAWDNTPLTTVGRGLVPVVYSRGSGQVDVSNTTTETSLVSVTVTGGHMSTDRLLRLTVLGDIAASASVACTMRFKFGGNTLWGDSMSTSGGTGATRIPWSAVFHLGNVNSASVQFSTGVLNFSTNDAGSVAGFGREDATIQIPFTGQDDRTFPIGESIAAAGDVNTASDQALVFSVQWGSASASVAIRRNYYLLELI